MPQQPVKIKASELEAAVSARAHEMMTASHRIMRERNANLASGEKPQPLPGWSTFLASATQEFEVVPDEEEAPAPAPGNTKKAKPAAVAAAPDPKPAPAPIPDAAPAN